MSESQHGTRNSSCQRVQWRGGRGRPRHRQTSELLADDLDRVCADVVVDADELNVVDAIVTRLVVLRADHIRRLLRLYSSHPTHIIHHPRAHTPTHMPAHVRLSTNPPIRPAGRATYHEIFEQWHTLVAVEVAAVLSSVGDHLGHMSTCACVHALHVHTWEHVHVCMYWPKCFNSVPCSSRTASCVQSC